MDGDGFIIESQRVFLTSYYLDIQRKLYQVGAGDRCWLGVHESFG
jgi:hypothetical protein